MCSLPVFLWFISLQLGVYFKNKVSLSNVVLIHHFPVALTTTTILKCQVFFCFHPFVCVCVCRSVVVRTISFTSISVFMVSIQFHVFFSFILFRSRVHCRYKIHFSNVYLPFNWLRLKINLRMCRQTEEIL